MTISTHGSSAKAIAAALREEIIAGQMQAGERLGEVALAERFNVSRGPVREALRSLAEAGLVSFMPNIGARVRHLTVEDAAALFEVRIALEAEAARLAAERAGSQGAERLRALLDRQEPAVLAHPLGAYLHGSRDTDFHAVVAELAGNPLVLRLLFEELYPQLVMLRRQHQHVEGRGVVALREHERIAEAIGQGEPELAAMLMRRHIRESWLSLKRQMVAQGDH